MRDRAVPGRLGRVGAGIFGVVLSWVMLELYVASFFREESRHFRFDCPTVDMTHPPLFEGPVNAHGFRDVEHTWEKPAGRFRLLVLGDSFTYGAGVRMAESFPAQLHRILRARYGEAVEVINAGVPGTGTAHHLAYYSEVGRLFSPDLVLLAYFDWNDAQDSANSGLYTLDEGGVLSSRHDPPKVSFGYRACHALANTTNPVHPFSWLRRSRLAVFTLNRLESLVGFSRWVWRSKNDPAVFRLTYALLGRFAEEVRMDGGRALLIRIPGSAEGDPEAITVARASHDFTLPYLDLQPVLNQAVERAGSRDAVYIPNDGHFTVEGNRVAAEAIADFLETRGFVQISK